MAEWVVVMTKPNSEAIAVENLQRQGFGCYFPRIRIARSNKAVTIKPLFPRYLFTSIDNFWYSIRGTRGVSHLLMANDGPALIPGTVIEAIRNREDQNGFIDLGKVQKSERFTKGEKVRATEGPLMGLDLLYEGMTANERVAVLADLLGQKVKVVLKDSILVAA